MYSHTKKVGSMGRYGARAGRKVRDEARKVEEESKKFRDCPSCSKKKTIRRVSSGVWRCRSCEVKFTGGAHLPIAKKKAYVVASSVSTEDAVE